MADNDHNFRIVIEMNSDTDLPSAVRFYQKIARVVTKFGIPFFKGVSLESNYYTIAELRTTVKLHEMVERYAQDRAQEIATKITNAAEEMKRRSENQEETEH